MNIPKAVAIVLLATSMRLYGVVETTLFHITTNATFTVPAGKVLIIENIAGDKASLFLQKGANGFHPFEGPIQSGLNLPIKIPEGWSLSGVDPLNPGMATDMWIFGSLVDPSDLYVSLQHQIDQIAVNGTTATLGIQTASARPARINVEKSAEVGKGWQTAENAVVAPTINKSRYLATVPIEADREFLRTIARPRER